LPSCVVARYDGPYTGRVIDADTHEPIAGAVVLGVWYREFPGPAGEINEFYDAEEAVTDKSGEFSLPGMGLQVLSNINISSLLIYKAGYDCLEASTWDSLKIDLLLRKKIGWEGEKAIIPIRKLSNKEGRIRSIPSRPDIPITKMRVLTNEINTERREQGLQPLSLER